MNSHPDLYEHDLTSNKLNSTSALQQNISKNDRSKSRSPIRKSTKDINKSPESDERLKIDQKRNSTVNPNVYGPALPPALCPVVAEPSPLTQSSSLPSTSVRTSAEVLNSDIYGPALPSYRSCNDSNDNTKVKIYGPARPPNMMAVTTKEISCEDGDKKEKLRNETADDNDGYYGPLPLNHTSTSVAHIALEERALQLKLGYLQDNKNNCISRETWMTELPDARTSNLGLGPRQFRATPAPDLSDRSSWTDTPEDKAKKELGIQKKNTDLEHEAKIKQQKRYDHEQRKAAEKHKKGTKEKSLLEIHQSSLKKKKKEEEHTRRPFNRETDLNINQFDAAQKKAILKKAELLNDRFASGHSKFL